jgi:hypothetical protein
MEQPTDKPVPLLTPEQLAAMSDATHKLLEFLKAYAVGYTAKLLLVVYGGYTNEEADKKLAGLAENGEKQEH